MNTNLNAGTVGGMIETPSGLRYIDFKYSGGPPVSGGQTVTVHYLVALALEALPNGPLLENSWAKNEPITFVLGKGEVLRGIDEGLEGMGIGSTRRIVVPPHLGFGRRGIPCRELSPDATLAFETYLVGIT